MASSNNLKELVRHQILDLVVKGTKAETGWKVLIVDAVALRMISACCTMTDFTDNDVTIIEDLAKTRQPHPDMDAVYLCYPAVVNAKAIEADFAETPLYNSAHIFFIDAAEPAVIQTLGRAAGLRSVVKCLTELNLNFIPKEDLVFTLDHPEGLREFYSPTSLGTGARDMAVHIASLCAALGDVPVVRYSGSSDKCADLAKFTHERIQALAKADDGMKKRKSQLIIIDRGEDLAAPLVHSLTYQAAVFDFLGDRIKGDAITYTYEDVAGQKRTNERVLGSKDSIWDELRHAHVDAVQSKVTKSLKKFQADNAAADLGAKTDTSALREMMQRAPQKREKTALFSLHIDLISDIISAAFQPFNEACVDAEQNMLTRRTRLGEKIKNPIDEVENLFKSQAGNGTEVARVRALAIGAVAAGGMTKDEVDHLCELGKIQGHRFTINNLQHFGLQVGYEGKPKVAVAPRRDSQAPNSDLTKYLTSRWTPMIKDFMVGAVKGTLDSKKFPSFEGPIPGSMEPRSASRSSGRQSSANRRWVKDDEKETEAPERNRLIVFVPGALGWNEVRCAYEVAEQYDVDVFIGSHKIVAPTEFLEMIKSL